MSCLKWTIIMLVGSFILIGLPIIIYIQIVKPRNPTFTVDRASITGFNLTADGQLTSFFDVSIWVHNPNHKLKLKYRRVRVSVFKDKQNLATDALPGFTQRKGNVTVLRAEPVALNVRLKNSPVYDFGVEKGMGFLNFDVFLTADLNADILEVDCKHVVVYVTATGAATFNSTQNFQSKSCNVLVYSND